MRILSFLRPLGGAGSDENGRCCHEPTFLGLGGLAFWLLFQLMHSAYAKSPLRISGSNCSDGQKQATSTRNTSVRLNCAEAYYVVRVSCKQQT